MKAEHIFQRLWKQYSSENPSAGKIYHLFQESGEQDTTRGASGSWDWRFAPRTNWILTASWQRIERDDSVNSGASDRDFWYIQPQLRRQIRRYLDGSLTYRFVRQDSEDDRNDYDENSVIARVTAYF